MVRATVPEAAINEDRDPVGGEQDIRTTCNFGVVQSVPNASSP
jgi:hypothetical protein